MDYDCAITREEDFSVVLQYEIGVVQLVSSCKRFDVFYRVRTWSHFTRKFIE